MSWGAIARYYMMTLIFFKHDVCIDFRFLPRQKPKPLLAYITRSDHKHIHEYLDALYILCTSIANMTGEHRSTPLLLLPSWINNLLNVFCTTWIVFWKKGQNSIPFIWCSAKKILKINVPTNEEMLLLNKIWVQIVALTQYANRLVFR